MARSTEVAVMSVLSTSVERTKAYSGRSQVELKWNKSHRTLTPRTSPLNWELLLNTNTRERAARWEVCADVFEKGRDEVVVADEGSIAAHVACF